MMGIDSFALAKSSRSPPLFKRDSFTFTDLRRR